MPLALIWWKQILVLTSAVLPITVSWGAVAANAIYPGWWADALYHFRHKAYQLRYRTLLARLRRGQCTSCGYNLRGNISGVCPECGAEVDFIPDRVIAVRHPRSR